MLNDPVVELPRVVQVPLHLLCQRNSAVSVHNPIIPWRKLVTIKAQRPAKGCDKTRQRNKAEKKQSLRTQLLTIYRSLIRTSSISHNTILNKIYSNKTLIFI